MRSELILNYVDTKGEMIHRHVTLQMFDSGLVVVVSIIACMILCVFVVLTYVQYEWCNVLFKNFTVSK